MKLIDHLSAWALVAAMMAMVFVWSVAMSTHDTSIASDAPSAQLIASPADLRAAPPSRRHFDLGPALGRFAGAGLGPERDGESEPTWARHEDVAAPRHSLPSTAIQYAHNHR